MKKVLNRNIEAGSRKLNGPRLAGEILHDYLENSNDAFAVAYRKHASEAEAKGETDHLFLDLHPDTHLGVDLKVMKSEPGRMEVGEMLNGAIARDDENHFTFLQSLLEKKEDYARNPHIYCGKHINVILKKDGELWLTFNRPHYTNKFTFQDLCQEAAKELLTVAGFVGKK